MDKESYSRRIPGNVEMMMNFIFTVLGSMLLGGGITRVVILERLKHKKKLEIVKHEHAWSEWEQYQEPLNEKDHWLVRILRPRMVAMQKRRCFGCNLAQQEKVGVRSRWDDVGVRLPYDD